MNQETMSDVRRFIELKREKDSIKQREREINLEMATLDESIVEAMMESGIQSMNVDGHTLYIRTDLFASPENGREELIDAIRRSGPAWDWLIQPNYNAAKLKSKIRELPRDEYGNPEIPPTLQGQLKLTFKPTVGLRKSTS
jgi:hypothetical protein